jgi:hypothetical protein
MHKSLVSVVAAALMLSPVVAQTRPFTVPPGFLTTENSMFSGVSPSSADWGRFGVGRHQIITGEWTGKGSKSLSRLSLRRDGERCWPGGGQGRSWTRVRVRLFEANYATVGNNMDRNMGTNSTVFSKPLSLFRGGTVPSQRPMPWGGSGLVFPFSSPYTYSGRKDLGVEFQFSGGRIQNWTAKNWSFYMLDAYSPASRYATDGYSIHGYPQCKDTNAKGLGVALYRMTSYARSGVNGSTGSRANTMDGTMFLHGCALDTWHTFFFGLGRTQGLYVGQGCNPIYLTQVLGVTSAKASSTGGYRRAPTIVPYNAAWVGIELWAQAAYRDSKLGIAKYTHATRSVIPAQPVTSTVKLVQIYRGDLTSAIGGKYSRTIPIMKFN